MKKMLAVCLVLAMACASLAACKSNVSVTPSESIMARVIVDIEGTVSAVNGSELTLDSGKTVVISGDTVFAACPGMDNEVSKDIAAGNFIQGYTKGDPDAKQVAVDRIYCNTAVQPGAGKILINFEGIVSSIEGNRVTLDNGKVLLLTDDTVYSIATGVVEHYILLEGKMIQGYTEDNPQASEITAARVHIIQL